MRNVTPSRFRISAMAAAAFMVDSPFEVFPNGRRELTSARRQRGAVAGAASIRVAILRCSVARDAQRTGSTPRIPGSLAPRLARDLPQHQTGALPGEQSEGVLRSDSGAGG